MAGGSGGLSRVGDAVQLAYLRFAASGWVSPRRYNRALPSEAQRAARSGNLAIEVVSHCWQYSHFLVYQLSSLVLFPPQKARVTMTVFYCPEDQATQRLLDYFQAIQVDNVVWNWQPLERQQLFRRAIGRNRAALATEADWVWFTDCDLLFRENCFDSLVDELQGRRDALVYPQEERCTEMLSEDNTMLQLDKPAVLDVSVETFKTTWPSRATGPLQITHGDVARALGYCDSLTFYQQPAENWCKAHEDRAHRWLLESQGVPVSVAGVYRIRHEFKGRYARGTWYTRLRTALRKKQSQRHYDQDVNRG